ncbi:hypothetical protein O0235_09220 [Tepidiforma flava]|uniref:Uncharacterized protein n=1 Tax=Tepidiforma flava TaxID=3004094 RepID=A0ABY7M2U0_9CHLR|nr:hypothetical protein [Tepidiforma flava]WBL34974.1 hypothetical protein O0235_09220 [Tepidiforma flava]
MIVRVSHCIYGGGVVDRSFEGAGALTEEVDGGVAGAMATDPGAFAAAGRVELAAALPEADEGVLDGFLGEGGVAQDLDGGSEGGAGVFGDDGIEGGGIAGAEAFEVGGHGARPATLGGGVIEVLSRVRTWGVRG